jgi:dipeptidyl-peptidase 4
MTSSSVSLQLTPERVARQPAPGMNAPIALAFTPDGGISFLFSEAGTLVRQLYRWDVTSGERSLLLEPAGAGSYSREEALRRERQRQYGQGITSYAWSQSGGTLLVPLSGEAHVRTAHDRQLRRVVEAPCIDPRLSADGTQLAFVRDGELYSIDLLLPDARPRRLTFDASPAAENDGPISNGLAEFAAQEELGRQHGFCWSPDGRFIAYEQVDASPIPLYPIVHQGEQAVDVETHRYPFAGAANVRWRLGFVRAQGGTTSWLAASSEAGGACGADAYLGRMDWTPDGALLVQLLARDQRTLELVRIEPLSERRTTLLTERAADWLNLSDDLRAVQAPGAPAEQYELIWSSERTGSRQLYLLDRNGRELRRLTPDDWPVDGVVAVDAARRLLYFAGSERPTERHLWRVSLDGGAPQRLSREPGVHGAVFARDHATYVETFHARDTPPRLTLRDASSGESLRELVSADRAEADALGLVPPELIEVGARDGTSLYGALWRARGGGADALRPLIIDVYGGPHVQQVTDSWALTANLRAQYLASRGFNVLALDNRGSARRGHAFEAAIWRQMGSIEVDDQVDGARYVAGLPGIDGARIGVYGWSYGGYMTLMSLLKAPDVFKAGVAGAPVTDWDGYDTAYTERYMETPQNNPDGYREASVLTHAAALRAPLLVLHGLLDENVHFRHTARLAAALNAAGKPYELAIFPNERHGPRDPTQRAALEQRIADFFARNL